MARQTTPLSLVLLALTLSVSCCQTEALATKLNAKPLPRNGDPAGKASYSRDNKDFDNSDNEALPTSRWQRRPDYRDVERQKAEDEAQKAKDAAQARVQAEAAKKDAERKQGEVAKKYRDEAILANNNGVLMGQQGRWPEALASHEKAVQYDPYNKQFRVNLSAARTAFGEKKMKDGDFSGAGALFRKALAAQPDNASAAKGLSRALEKAGFDPIDPDVRMNIGDQLLAGNDMEGAYIEYTQALQVEPSAKVYVKLGDMEYRYRRVAQAQSYYQQAIVKDASYGPAHRQLGLLKLALKDETGGAALLRKAIICDSSDAIAGQALCDIWRAQVAKNPLNADSHLGLAGALQLTGDFTGAESEYKKLEMLNASHPGLADGRATLGKAYHHARADKHKKAADTLFGQGLRKEALAEISQAVMIEPRNSKFQFLLGECLEANGDYKSAHQAYLTVVLIDPDTREGKEAAARMKEMQNYASSPQHQQQRPQQSFNGAPQQQFQHQRMPMQQQMPAQQQMPVQQSMPMPQQQNMVPARYGTPSTMNQIGYAPQKNMFEGGPGMNGFAPQGAMPNFNVNQQVNVNPQAGYMQSPYQPAASNVRNFPQGNANSTMYSGVPAQHNVNVPQSGTPVATQAPQDPKLVEVSQAEQSRNFMQAANILREVVAGDLENAENHHRLAVNLMGAGRISEAVTEFRIASALKPTVKTYADDLARALAINKRSVMVSTDKSENAEGGGN